MPPSRSLISLLVSRIAMGIVAAIVFVIAARLMHFPQVFQIMFVLYAFLGTLVYILLDAPPVTRLDGLKAVVALIAFYAVISGVFIAGANMLPQYDPQVEKGKIDKIVKPKMAATEKGRVEELLKRTEELNAHSQAILKRLETLGGASVKNIEASVKGKESGGPKASGAGGDLFQANTLAKQVIGPPREFGCIARGVDSGICRGARAPEDRPASRRRTHRTFMTTSVRSSVMAVPRVNS